MHPDGVVASSVDDDGIVTQMIAEPAHHGSQVDVVRRDAAGVLNLHILRPGLP